MNLVENQDLELKKSLLNEDQKGNRNLHEIENMQGGKYY